MFRIHNLLAVLALASMACLTTTGRADDAAPNGNKQNRADQQHAVKGTVQSVSEDHRQIVVRDENNRDWAIQIAKDARVRVNDQEAQASDLKDGDQVTVNFRQVARHVMATQGEKAGQFTAGRVERTSENQLTIKNHQGQEQTFQVAQNAAVRVNGKTAKSADLKEGDHVVVAYSKNGDTSEATEVISASEGRGAGLAAGQVESVSADHNQIVLKDQSGAEHTFQLGQDAQVRVNNREGRASDLQQGNQAAVAYSRVATEVAGSRGNK
jgi:ribosomal 50S subunit-recycling heat shock protein